ncbi:alpha-L-fucosidase [Reichenbachiella carrageenanivorans]|uniref:alpha-L-fucosidase n=1 Tax=Reichenbachiella carrageenanivorans TaxID=2979869 RepID=A0ABY6D160_9BACT|nr:alpha-L-fucosidase [Reichenbachiella carrageenanivorans]UXX79853.1 alpha-L-fucosidase [Reichenbachiella carrageenanivorans]
MKRYITIVLLLAGGLATAQNKSEKGMDELWGERNVKEANYLKKDYKWYQQAKFAMFIHWGLYSDLAGEWQGEHYFGINEWIMKRAQIPTVEYKKMSAQFNPVDFDADAIAQLAVDAGMKYLVITAKHHDGFALFDTKASDFDVMDATPFKRDIVKELAEAARAKGLKFGFYYSQTQDWTEKNGYGNTWDYNWEEADFDKYLKKKALPQIKELLTNYGEIGCIFFDTPGPIKESQVLQIKDMVEKYQPNCLINSRIGQGLGDFVSMGDNQIPNKPLGGLWETPDTHNNTWAYSKLDINWKTPEEIVHRLINVITKGGNYMFNIGPTGQGTVPEMSSEILRNAGDWIKNHEEAIYQTVPVDIGGQSGLGATRSKDKTYIFIKEWPDDGRVWLPSITGGVSKAYFLDNDEPVEFKQLTRASCLMVPIAKHEAIASVIVLEHENDGLTFQKDKMLSSGVSNILYPHEAVVSGAEQGEERWMEIFGDWHSVATLTNWKEKGSQAQWTIQVPKPGLYTIEINYACDQSSDLQEGRLSIDDVNYHFVPTFSGNIDRVVGQDETRRMTVFKTRKIGVIKFDESGKHTVSISLNDKDETGWIKLSKVILNPVEM